MKKLNFELLSHCKPGFYINAMIKSQTKKTFKNNVPLNFHQLSQCTHTLSMKNKSSVIIFNCSALV